MNHCVDCVQHRPGNKCASKLIDTTSGVHYVQWLVDGKGDPPMTQEPIYCFTMRSPGGDCGPGGKLFVKRT